MTSEFPKAELCDDSNNNKWCLKDEAAAAEASVRDQDDKHRAWNHFNNHGDVCSQPERKLPTVRTVFWAAKPLSPIFQHFFSVRDRVFIGFRNIDQPCVPPANFYLPPPKLASFSFSLLAPRRVVLFMGLRIHHGNICRLGHIRWNKKQNYGLDQNPT